MPSKIHPHPEERSQSASRRTQDVLAVLLTAVPLAISGCARHYPPAPVVSGGAAAARPPASLAQPIETPHPDSIVVAPGETLYGVSRKYGVPIRAIVEANNLTPPFRLVSGRPLSLPQVRQYVVQPGDTLYGIARRFNIEPAVLAQGNNIPPPYPVHVGQALVLPMVQVAAASPAPPPAPPPVAAATGPIAPPPQEDRAPTSATAAVSQPASPAAPPAVIAPVPKPDETSAAKPPDVMPSAKPPEPPPAVAAVPPPEPIAAPPHTGRGFQWPVHGEVVVGYGPGSSGAQNDGINIAADLGAPIAAANDGIVAYAGNELRGFGNLILLKHADGWTTAYAHCEKLLVKRGDRVRRGQTIATVGVTGAVAEPQLHFEIRRGTQPLDPMSYLPPVATATAG